MEKLRLMYDQQVSDTCTCTLYSLMKTLSLTEAKNYVSHSINQTCYSINFSVGRRQAAPDERRPGGERQLPAGRIGGNRNLLRARLDGKLAGTY